MTLDSMQWRVKRAFGVGNLGNIGAWTTVSITGRMVSQRPVSLVGVGVLVEGLRDTTVVHRMIDSTFHVARSNPIMPQAGTVINLERVRPRRPVPVGVAALHSGFAVPETWGCPTRARVVRLRTDSVADRSPPVPDDETPISDYYEWDPRSFDANSALDNVWGAAALLEGPRSERGRTDFVIVRSKILYRTIQNGALYGDSMRLGGAEMTRYLTLRNALLSTERSQFVRLADRPLTPPAADTSVLLVRHADALIERRFPTDAPPPEIAQLVTLLLEMRALSARRAAAAR